jgi:hypothetical protein
LSLAKDHGFCRLGLCKHDSFLVVNHYLVTPTGHDEEADVRDIICQTMADFSDNLKKVLLSGGSAIRSAPSASSPDEAHYLSDFGHQPNVSWIPLRNKNVLSNSGMPHHVFSLRMKVLYAWESRYLKPQVVWDSKPSCKSHEMYTPGSYTRALSYLLRVTKKFVHQRKLFTFRNTIN